MVEDKLEIRVSQEKEMNSRLFHIVWGELRVRENLAHLGKSQPHARE